MTGEQTTNPAPTEELLSRDSTSEADKAAKARQKDYRATVKWNEKRSDSKSTGA